MLGPLRDLPAVSRLQDSRLAVYFDDEVSFLCGEEFGVAVVVVEGDAAAGTDADAESGVFAIGLGAVLFEVYLVFDDWVCLGTEGLVSHPGREGLLVC